MPTFQYSAINTNGKTVKGKLTAVNELDLEERLKELDLDVLTFRALKPKKGGVFGKISVKELVMFCIHLEQLDKAGVPLLDSLADMRDSADSPVFRDIMADIYENVRSGDIGGLEEVELQSGEFNPQEVLNQVIGSPMEDTKKGKELIKKSIEAQNVGEDVS